MIVTSLAAWQPRHVALCISQCSESTGPHVSVGYGNIDNSPFSGILQLQKMELMMNRFDFINFRKWDLVKNMFDFIQSSGEV